jgi:hypothetical protein
MKVEDFKIKFHIIRQMVVKKEKRKEAKMLDEVVDLILRVCKSKGWATNVRDRDNESFRCATIDVTKEYYKNYMSETIHGSIDLYIGSGNIQLSMNKISFYNYGLDSLTTMIKSELYEIEWVKAANSPKTKTDDKDKTGELITHILDRFDRAVRQFKRRHDNRSTIVVKDEYDTQDALHAILKCYFDDVRPEEFAPSHAGSSSRVDFLLKKEQVVIEIKYASNKLSDKKIGEQLIIDIKRYENHPDCKALYCFVYDPDGNIKNPVALENDLSGEHGPNKMKVKVIIAPK